MKYALMPAPMVKAILSLVVGTVAI